jgi:hypothetical protein
MYVATINVPGYPTDADFEPPEFEDAVDAWRYLRDERRAALEDADEGHEFDESWIGLRNLSEWEGVGEGTVYGSTPGGAMHDLGLAYCVTAVQD